MVPLSSLPVPELQLRERKQQERECTAAGGAATNGCWIFGGVKREPAASHEPRETGAWTRPAFASSAEQIKRHYQSAHGAEQNQKFWQAQVQVEERLPEFLQHASASRRSPLPSAPSSRYRRIFRHSVCNILQSAGILIEGLGVLFPSGLASTESSRCVPVSASIRSSSPSQAARGPPVSRPAQG